jgi:tetratricopeptide (TPR) repeat protein/CHAT domain-containing protein
MTTEARAEPADGFGPGDPAQVLIGAWQAAVQQSSEVPRALACASSPQLARAATASSCRVLVTSLTSTHAKGEPGACLLAELVLRHASALDDLGRYREALALQAVALSVLEALAPPAHVAGWKMTVAITLYNLGWYEEALAGYEEALPLLRLHGLLVDVARCLANRAGALQKTGRYAEAEAGYGEALPLFRRHGSPADVAGCLMNRAYTLESLGRYAEAVEGYDEALLLFRQLDSRMDLARCLMNRANTLQSLGRYAEAVTGYGEALPLFREHGLPANVASCLMNRASTLQSLGRYAEAVAGYGEALPLFRQHSLPAEVAGCLMNRANTLQSMGRYAEAVAGYEEALPLYRHHGLPVDLARCLMNRASTLQSMGRYSEAVSGYGEALPLFRQHGLPADLARCLTNRANTLQSMGVHAGAVAGYEEALPLFLQHGLPADLARCLASRANALESMGRSVEAVAGYGEALPLFRQHGLAAEVAGCLMNRANTLQSMDCFAEAVAAYEQIDCSALSEDDRVKYHGCFAGALCKVGQTSHGLEQYTLCRRTLRRARHLGGIDETSLEFVAIRQGNLHEAVRVALEEGRYALAFDTVQDGKAGVLGDLRQRLPALVCEDPELLLEARKELTDWLRVGLPLPPGRSAGRFALDPPLEAYLQTFRITTKLGRLAGEGAGSSSGEEPEQEGATLARVQAVLPADWALLDFWQSDENLTVFVVTRTGFRVVPLRPFERNPRLRERLGQLVGYLENPLSPPVDWDQNGSQVWNDLRQCVFADLLPHLDGISGLYLVPHGLWHAVPLHAAQWHDPVTGDPVYLADRFAIAYLPSAALLPDLPPLRLAGRVLSLANPDRGREGLTLPFSEWEARRLQATLPFSGEFSAGEDATLDRADHWEETALLHFSCHGMGDERFAPLSRLSLRDDFLLAHDVVYRRPPLPEGALVVLNGCQTAVRDWRAVDEGMGLMSAFLLRGAGLVLATQWSVLDHCAAEMVTTFLEALVNRGVSPTDALRLAQQRARTISPREIEERCEEVLQLFPEQQYPCEAAQIHTLATKAARNAGRWAGAREHGPRAEALPRPAGGKAERVGALSREGCWTRNPERGGDYDDPLYWAAFQLVGRVT